MSTDDRTQHFVAKIESDAAELNAKIEQETNAEIEKLFAVGKEKIDAEISENKDRKIQKLKQEAVFDISHEREAERIGLIKKREEIVAEIYSDVKSALLEYTKTEEYKIGLRRAVADIEKQFGKPLNLIFNERDLEFGKDLCCNTEKSDSIMLGGFKAYVANGTKLIDLTLDTRFKNEMKELLKKPELVIE